MQGLKFILLTFSFCLNLSAIDFANTHISFYDGRSSFPSNSSYKKVNDVEFLSNSYLRIGNLVYSYSTSGDNLFNLFLKKGDGFYSDEGMSKLEFYDSSHEKYTVYCESNTARSCSFAASTSYPAPVEFSYFKTYYISYFVTCPADQHFNTDTKKCQKCKENELWDPETNTCFNDCRKDGKINKFAFTDGSCIDCSGEKDPLSVLKCICRGYGNSSIDPTFWGKNGGSLDGCQLEGSCGDGSIQHSFTNPNCKPDNNPDPKPDPKPDENKTKPDDPKPDDPDSPDPDNKDKDKDKDKDEFCKKNPDDPKCKPDDFCKKNPDDPKCKPDNNNTKPGGGGGGGFGDNLKFNESDFNYDGLKGDYDGFKNRYASEVEGLKGKFDDLKTGLNQFIENVKGNGFTSFQNNSVQNTCPLKYNVELGFYSSVIEVDFCKLLEPIRTIIYYFVYIAVFTGFLLLTVKLIMFSF